MSECLETMPTEGMTVWAFAYGLQRKAHLKDSSLTQALSLAPLPLERTFTSWAQSLCASVFQTRLCCIPMGQWVMGRGPWVGSWRGNWNKPPLYLFLSNIYFEEGDSFLKEKSFKNHCTRRCLKPLPDQHVCNCVFQRKLDTKSEGMEQLAESGCHFSRRLHTNMQIQVGFSFQEKAWEKRSRHIQSHLLRQNTVTDIDTESLPLPELQFNRLLTIVGLN